MTMMEARQGTTAPPPPSASPLETDVAHLAPAQLVWLRAVEVAHQPDPARALELVRLARSEPSVLQHALTLGRSHADVTDAVSNDATAALEAALALLAGR